MFEISTLNECSVLGTFVEDLRFNITISAPVALVLSAFDTALQQGIGVFSSNLLIGGVSTLTLALQ